MERLRRRLVSAVSTLAFGLGVTMAGSLGVSSYALGLASLPSPTLVLGPRHRGDAFAATATPAQPYVPPSPPVRVAVLPRLAPLARRGRPAIEGPLWGGILILTAVLFAVAVLSWPTRCHTTWDGWLLGESCSPHATVTVPLVIAAVVWAGGVALMIPGRRATGSRRA